MPSTHPPAADVNAILRGVLELPIEDLCMQLRRINEALNKDKDDSVAKSFRTNLVQCLLYIGKSKFGNSQWEQAWQEAAKKKLEA